MCACRAAYFGLMTSIWAALPVEAVAGFVFSLYWPSSAKIFDEMAPEGTKNIVQGLGAFNFAAGKSGVYESWCESMINDEMCAIFSQNAVRACVWVKTLTPTPKISPRRVRDLLL